MTCNKYLFLLIIFNVFFSRAYAQDTLTMDGIWQLIPDESSALSFYHTVSLKIEGKGPQVTVVKKWEAQLSKTDSLTVSTDGEVNRIPVTDRVWPYQVFMGVSLIPGTDKEVEAKWADQDRTLQVDESYPILLSQGRNTMHTLSTYSLSDNGEQLTLNVENDFLRSQNLTYVFRRGTPRKAYYMDLDDHWEMNGLLSENAFLISLQGIVNTHNPVLYFKYPDDYDYRFTGKLLDYYKDHLGYSLTKISDLSQALQVFKDSLKGYVVWDKSVRPSLNVAFTVAGLKKAVVVTSDMIPMMKAAGLKEVADFRNKFENKTDAQIYEWAFGKYGDKCNKKYLIWMGGISGNKMQPGIADFGVSKQCFFTDLSTDPADTVEYALASRIMGHMKPLSLVMGWHDYSKDLERNYVTLASHHGLRVEGLNTFPNLSFTSRTPPLPGFKFRNYHQAVPGGIYKPEKKVYITCVQTDGLGLGAWNDSTRGSVPYAWEVTINWSWMCPVLLEYYYQHATNNDFFFGSLSGPGYMYPKAIPPHLLPSIISLADSLCRNLDLNVFETMDYSEGSTVVGNTNLPEYIVNDYYKYMPDMIGFLNGYAPSQTFSSKDGRPFISYDYYLDENRPVNDAADDLKELISMNKKRPYFLLLHVREWNSIQRVKDILGQLGKDVEVVPLDVFLKMAGQQPTFDTYFLK